MYIYINYKTLLKLGYKYCLLYFKVTWIGYPNSTGLESIDYRISDYITDPKDSHQVCISDSL